jgi:hypothetical protein
MRKLSNLLIHLIKPTAAGKKNCTITVKKDAEYWEDAVYHW